MKALETVKGWSTTTKVLVGVGVIGAIAAIFYMFSGSSKPAGPDKGAKPGDPAKPLDPKTAAADDKAKKDHAGKVAGAASTAGAGAQTPAGTVVGADASGNPIVAPANGATGPAEGSAVIYIAPHGGDGHAATGAIEVRTGDALFTPGQLVQLTTPQYNGQYTIQSVWDSGDGTGSSILSVPYVDTQNLNSAGLMEDDSPGTITVLGDPSATMPAAIPGAGPIAPANQVAADQSLVPDASSALPVGIAAPSDAGFGTDMDSFEGMPGDNSNLEFSYAFGNIFKKIGQFTRKELAGLANLIKGKKGSKGKMYIRLIPVAEGQRRIVLAANGQKKGLKGAALKSFIMKNK